MVTVVCVEKGRQRSDNHVWLQKVTSFHLHQTPDLSTHGRCPARAQIPFCGAYNHLAALTSKQFPALWVSLNVGVWYSDAIFSGLLALQRHIIPLCKCCGKFSKACELLRAGTVQPLICAAVCGEEVQAPALRWRNSTLPTIAPAALHPLSSPQPPPSPVSAQWKQRDEGAIATEDPSFHWQGPGAPVPS